MVVLPSGDSVAASCAAGVASLGSSETTGPLELRWAGLVAVGVAVGGAVHPHARRAVSMVEAAVARARWALARRHRSTDREHRRPVIDIHTWPVYRYLDPAPARKFLGTALAGTVREL